MGQFKYPLIILCTLLLTSCTAGQVAINKAEGGQGSLQSGAEMQQVPATSPDMDSRCTGDRACVPSLNKPVFISVGEADRFLADSDGIMGVVYGGEAKAY